MAETCGLCGAHTAKYVCASCGNTVCETCFFLKMKLHRVHDYTRGPHGAASKPLGGGVSNHLLTLFFTCSLIVIVGIVLMTVSILFSEPGSLARGAVIFIGPIPLLLGSGVFSFPVFLYAILLTVLGIRFFMKQRLR